MGDTKIEWAEKVWNPIRGCSRVSRGCERCYAERMAARFSKACGFPHNGNIPEPFHGFAQMTPSGPHWTGRVELIPEKLEEPLRWRKPKRIFVNSMGDLFHENLPDEVIDKVFAVMALCPQHIFMVLTKRAQRMREYFSAGRERIVRRAVDQRTDEPFRCDQFAWPLPNVWFGVSVEDRKNKDRIDILRDTPAALRFISLEPLLEGMGELDLRGISWVIAGGESGPGARPCNVSWLRSIIRHCRKADVECFVKQLGSFPVVEPCSQHHYDFGECIGRKERFSPVDKLHPSTEFWRVHFKNRKGGDPSEWPEDLRVRQFPEATSD